VSTFSEARTAAAAVVAVDNRNNNYYNSVNSKQLHNLLFKVGSCNSSVQLHFDYYQVYYRHYPVQEQKYIGVYHLLDLGKRK
jgi:hypothetical protein